MGAPGWGGLADGGAAGRVAYSFCNVGEYQQRGLAVNQEQFRVADVNDVARQVGSSSILTEWAYAG